jgi:hypothetical protein
MKHIASNTAKIEFYNRMKKLCSPLSGGRNSSPQNSGVIMAHIHLSRPIFRSNGNCIKNGSYADGEQVRGEENIKTLILELTDEELKYFNFMKIVERKPAYFGGFKTEKWHWIKCNNKDEVLLLIENNKLFLN